MYDQGIRSLGDLKSHQSILNTGQKIGLKHMEDFSQKIPREEVATIFDRIRGVVEKLDPGYVVTACGSFRQVAQKSILRTSVAERVLFGRRRLPGF